MAPNPEKVYNGRPCKNCSKTLKWKRGRSCVCCDRERAKKYHRENKQKVSKQRKIYKANNKEKVRKQKREERIRNKERIYEYSREWNKDKWANDPDWRLKKKIAATKSRARKKLEKSRQRSILYGE